MSSNSLMQLIRACRWAAEKPGENPSRADRHLARIEKHDIVRHQAEQADKIACVDGTDPGRVHFADCSFIRSHLQPPGAAKVIAAATPKTIQAS
jgi:hypothetical protein